MKVVVPLQITDAIITSSTVPENDAAAYSAFNTYSLGQEVIVAVNNNHYVFRSLQNANTGNDPLAEPADITTAVWWLKLGATNRWRVFDNSVTTQTVQAESINYVLNPPGRINAICLLNVSAKEVHVRMTDAIFGVVYDKTHPLIYYAGINDYYAYCFEPITEIDDLAITDLPNYANVTLELTFSRPRGNVKVGAIVIGNSFQVGVTQKNATVGIIDYSVKSFDQFGSPTITQRAYSKEAEFTLSTKRDELSKIQTFLAKLRATPCVYIGSEQHGCTMVYGWYESFQQLVPYEIDTVSTIKIKGLT